MRLDQHHFKILPGEGFEAAVAVDDLHGRWIRAGLFYGEAPGSNMMGKHFAFWRTRLGAFHGINIRVGWWPEPCVTFLLHTRPVRTP